MLIMVDLQGVDNSGPYNLPWLMERVRNHESLELVIFGPEYLLEKVADSPRIEKIAIPSGAKGQYLAELAIAATPYIQKTEPAPDRLLITPQPGLQAAAMRRGCRVAKTIQPGLLGMDSILTTSSLVEAYRTLAAKHRDVLIDAWGQQLIEVEPRMADKKYRHLLFGTSRFSRIANAAGLFTSKSRIVGERRGKA